MWKHKNLVSAVVAIAMLAFCWPVHEAAVAQTKANVPKPQNTLLLREDATKQLLLLMDTDKNGKITRQEWMRFMGEEFDKLDKDKKGELDPRQFRQSVSVRSATGR